MRIKRSQLRQIIKEALDDLEEEEDYPNERKDLLGKLVSLSWSAPSHAAALAASLNDKELLSEFWQEWKWISDYIFWETISLGGAGASYNPIELPTDRTDRVRKISKWLGSRPDRVTGWRYDFKIDVAELGNIRPNLEGVDVVDDDGERVWAPGPENLKKEVEYIKARDNFISKYANTFNQYMSSRRPGDQFEVRDVRSSGLLGVVSSAFKEREGGDDITEGKKASKSKGKPYKGSRRGKTESQAQQMAAGIALSAREKHGKAGAIKRLKGASKSMAAMSMEDLRKLATIRRGSEVPDSTKKGRERAALPGHIKKKK